MSDQPTATDSPPPARQGILALTGQVTIDLLAAFGNFWVFAGHTARRAIVGFRRRDLQRLIPQFHAIGTTSVPVVSITGLFVGMVLAVQSIEQFMSAGLANRMGVIVSLSVVRELGPVLAGVMLAGRVGGALTAELGTMKVTEQIDALRAMGSDPIRVLAAPRFMTCLLLTPILTMYTNLTGVFGGWLISVPVFKLSNHDYWSYTEAACTMWDISNGLIKSVFFGTGIGLISCYKGFHSRQGAQGVGKACTEAFVTSFMAILIMDFFIALGLKGIYESLWGFKPVF